MPYVFTGTLNEWALRVFRLRRKYRKSQKWLADALGRHVCTIQRWEYAEHRPDTESVQRFFSLERKLRDGNE
jgi:DNA-binding transcriptional regulator YiaG